jgi:hypothetical protein
MKPSEIYTIKVLSSEDYDNLPYDGAKDSLGMSVMDTKTAYIRSTGVKGMDQGTINHEFDELMQQTSPHEINGIRYKSGGSIGKIIGNAIGAVLALAGFPGAGVALSTATNLGTAPSIQAAAKKKAETRAEEQRTAATSQLNQLFKPTGATQAFAPGSAGGGQTATPKPLGLDAFNTSLASLDKNKAAQEKSVFDKFRGLGTPQSNTAFNTSLGQARTSSAKARSDFLEDQRKLGSTFA